MSMGRPAGTSEGTSWTSFSKLWGLGKCFKVEKVPDDIHLSEKVDLIFKSQLNAVFVIVS